MATAIDLSLGTKLVLNTEVTSTSPQWRVSIGYTNPGGASSGIELIERISDRYLLFLFLFPTQFGDTARVRSGGTNYDIAGGGNNPLLGDGLFHTADVYSDGATLYFELDGALVATEAFTAGNPLTGWDALQPRVTNGLLEFIEFYESSDKSALVHSWHAADSDTSNTGAQPILIDSVSGNNATGAGYPTDGSAFVVETVPPSLALGAAPQLGATLSGTGSNYAAQPTGPISITQGARSLPDMPITVSAWDAATGSFNWTTNAALPGFPANGADATPFVLTGENVTITLPDPGA